MNDTPKPAVQVAGGHTANPRKFTVRHPQRQKVTRNWLIAYGEASGAELPQGTVISGAIFYGNELIAAQRSVLSAAPSWRLFFRNLPESYSGKNLRLEVWVEGDPRMRASAVFPFALGFTAGIAHPQDGDPVCDEFTSYGDRDAGQTVSGRLVRIDAGSPDKAADLILYPDDTTWAMSFSGLVDGGEYDLVASFNNPTDSETAYGLNATDC